MCSKHCCGLTTIVLVVVCGLFVQDMLSFLDFFKVLEYTDSHQKCQYVQNPEGLVGSEDLTHYKDDMVFVSAGDIGTVFNQGSKVAVPGGVFIFRFKTKSTTKLKIEGFPEGRRFQPHGIFFSNSTSRLYAVSHGDELGGTVVEIFDVLADSDGIPMLKHRLTADSPLFDNTALNDVAEGSLDGSDFYVTRWRAWPYPVGGESNLKGMDKVGPMLELASSLTKRRYCVVYHCTLGPQAKGPVECTVAISGLQGANGITINPERTAVFVSDPAAKEILSYIRAADGVLTHVSSFQVKHCCDNLEWHVERKSLQCGSIGALLSLVEIMDKMKETNWKGALPDGAKPVAGGLLEITLLEVGQGQFTLGSQTDLIMHNGTTLSPISAALVYGDQVLLGSPFRHAVALCPAPK